LNPPCFDDAGQFLDTLRETQADVEDVGLLVARAFAFRQRALALENSNRSRALHPLYHPPAESFQGFPPGRDVEEWLVHIGDEVHEETSVRCWLSRRDTMQRVDSIDQDHEDVSIVLHGLDELRPLVIDVYRSAKAAELPSVAQFRAKPPDLEVASDRVVVFLAQVEKPGEEGLHTVDMRGSHGAGARGGGVTGDLCVKQNVFVRERIDPTHADCKLFQLLLALEAAWVEVDQALAEDVDELIEERRRRMILD